MFRYLDILVPPQLLGLKFPLLRQFQTCLPPEVAQNELQYLSLDYRKEKSRVLFSDFR